MKSRVPVVGLAIACAACCIPLLFPLLAGTGLVAEVASLSMDLLVCGMIGVGAAGLAGYLFISRRRRNKAACGCTTSCDPAKGCGPAHN
jgi:hypothetical protein